MEKTTTEFWDDVIAESREYIWNPATRAFEITDAATVKRLRYVSLGWDRFEIACHLPGKALAVLCLVQLQTRLKRTSTIVLNGAITEPCGIDRKTIKRDLQFLEAAGLVRVEHHKGRKPRITLLDLPKKPAPERCIERGQIYSLRPHSQCRGSASRVG